MILSVAALFAQSCKDDDFGPTLNPVTAPSLTSPAAGTSYVLTQADSAKIFGSFDWTSADFGFRGGVTYSLEMDLTSDNFAAPLLIGTTSGLHIGNKIVYDINSLLLTKGLPGGQEVSVDLRVTAKVNDKVNPLVSKTVTIKVTPYKVVVPIPQLQVPGDYQGWDPSKSSTVIFAPKFDHKYEGYVYFPNATTQFKYTNGPTWDVNYGDNGADGTLELNGSNITATGAGMYRLNVNLNALTHTFLLTNWSLIGSATAGGWSTDSDMTYDAVSGALVITTDLVAGDIKFRANHDWGVNFGDDGADKILDYGGANIAVAQAGNYTIKLLLNVPNYTYTITKN